MSVLDGLYVNPHHSQYEAGASAITRTAGCTWTSGANGANASTGGAQHPGPDTVHALVQRSQETNPATPGWSLPDLDLAMSRLGVPFDQRTGWSALVAAHDAGLYLAVQGDSDQFAPQTCSGNFDGDHCIGVHPANTIMNGQTYWWIDDPICPTGRWEKSAVIRAYAAKLSPTILFGAFTHPVPKTTPQRYAVTISGLVPVYDKPYGTVVGHVRRAEYLCTRTRSTARWWYRILTRADGSPAAFRGRYLPQEADPPMKVVRA